MAPKITRPTHYRTQIAKFCRVTFIGRFESQPRQFSLFFITNSDRLQFSSRLRQSPIIPHLKDLTNICLEKEAEGPVMSFKGTCRGSKYPQIILYTSAFKTGFIAVFGHGLAKKFKCPLKKHQLSTKVQLWYTDL